MTVAGVRSARELMDTDWPDELASDLLADERCHPLCLLALGEADCTCVCNGYYHGALKDANVTQGLIAKGIPA